MTTRIVFACDAQAVARDLRDAGVEVIYLGPADPSHVVRVAIQEDADAVATDEQAGLARLLADEGADDIDVLSPDAVLAWVATPR
ncbi:MAG: hypothetical protein M3548_13630 [Actinomycetota bacterium]|nr:hypothetical protein [Actinomycetota bacterium]